MIRISFINEVSNEPILLPITTGKEILPDAFGLNKQGTM